MTTTDGTTGEYTCEMCHDLKGQQALCANSTIPIIGVPSENDLFIVWQLFICIHEFHADPPNIIRGDGKCEITPFFGIVQCHVGTNYCISDPALNNLPLVREIRLDCFHDPIGPVISYPLRAMWFLNGELIDAAGGRSPSNFITTEENGQRLVITSAANAVRGNYTCQLSNTAGSDVVTSIISNCSSK